MAPRQSRLRRFACHSDGNIMILSALILPLAVIFCGLIIDEASLGIEERRLQNAVDMAAISAASNIDSAETLARAVLSDNGMQLVTATRNPDPTLPDIVSGDTTAKIEKGRYTADISLPVHQRFTAGSTPYNAVRVTAQRTGSFVFNPLAKHDPVYSRTAVATLTPQVAYSLGSRLVSLDDGLANLLLSELTGSEISLSAMDYNALASANVSALGFLDALATNASLTAVTYDDVLDANVTMGQVVGALATMTSGATSTTLQQLDTALSGNTQPVPLRNIINPGPAGNLRLGEGPSQVAASLGAMDIIGASALFSHGDSQIDIDLSPAVPGLVSTELSLVIGEPMQHSGWFRIGSNGDILQTAQTRLRLTAGIAAGDMENNAIVTLPLYAELAYAAATVSNASCAYKQPLTRSATILTKPGVVRLWIGDEDDGTFADFSKTIQPDHATLVTLPLARIKAKAAAEVGNQTGTPLQFSAYDINSGITKTATSSQFTQSLTGSLLDTIDVKVEALGLSIGLSGGLLASKLSDLLEAQTSTLDSVLATTLETLGLSLGEADVRVHDVQCSLAMLVD